MRIVENALTFDDVLLQPAFSEVLPRDVSLVTRLTRDIHLNLAIVSAAMDTVTEARLAIALAQEGGIGIIHKNMTAESQAREVRLPAELEGRRPRIMVAKMGQWDAIEQGMQILQNMCMRMRYSPKPVMKSQIIIK